MGAMQKLAGLMRRAIEKYDMIQPGDRIAVGVSGGKDSVALLVGLAKLKAVRRMISSRCSSVTSLTFLAGTPA